MKKICTLILIFSVFTSFFFFEKGKHENQIIGGRDKVQNTPEYYDNDDPIFQTNKYLSYYFYNLNENFGNNEVGSCGYVAMAMLLSFYDTFWDDNIIDERFDKIESLDTSNLSNTLVSPGIKKDNPNNVSPSSVYYNEMQYLSSNDYFHPFLICYAEDKLNYYEKYGTTYPCQMMGVDFKPLLEEYLYEYKQFKKSDVEVEYFNETNVLNNFLIPRIKQGIPVVLYMLSTDGFHYVIAYDYDETRNQVYCHFGWHEFKTANNSLYYNHIRLSSASDYFTYWSGFALKFNTAHNCSNNYFEVSSNEFYCPCYFNIHPSHSHSYVNYSNFNRVKHSGLCYCGMSVFLPHIVREGTDICILCGGTTDSGFSGLSRQLLINPIKNSIWTNSSILSNGVIVISDGDYIKLLNGELEIPILEEK